MKKSILLVLFFLLVFSLGCTEKTGGESPADITDLRLVNSTCDTLSWAWQNPASDFDHVEIWLNGELVLNTVSDKYTATGLAGNTTYLLKVVSVDVSSNKAAGVGMEYRTPVCFQAGARSDILIDIYGGIGDYSHDSDKVETLNVFVCFSQEENAYTDAPNPEEAMAWFKQGMGQLKEYYNEAAYGKVNLNINFVGDVNFIVGSPPANSGTQQSNSSREGYGPGVENAIRKCDKGIDFNKTDLLIVYPTEYVGNGLHRVPLKTDDGVVTLDAILLPRSMTSDRMSYVVPHEAGHALFGLPHADGISCGAEPFKTEGCTVLDYGNPYDVMGSGKGHYSGWLKYGVGLIQSSDAMKDGTYELGAQETPSSYPQLLTIPYKDNQFCIEYRKPLGFDSFYGSADVGGIRIPEKGCLLVSYCGIPNNRKYAYPQNFFILYADPENAKPTYCVEEGETMRFDDLGINLHFKEANNDHAMVDVDIDEEKIESLPDLTLTPISVDNSCNFTGNITFTIYNKNRRDLELGSVFESKLSGIDVSGKEYILVKQSVEYSKPYQNTKITYNNKEPLTRIIVSVDSAGNINESDESNNRYEQGVKC